MIHPFRAKGKIRKQRKLASWIQRAKVNTNELSIMLLTNHLLDERRRRRIKIRTRTRAKTKTRTRIRRKSAALTPSLQRDGKPEKKARRKKAKRRTTALMWTRRLKHAKSEGKLPRGQMTILLLVR